MAARFLGEFDGMSIILPEIEIVDRSSQSLRYLEHGWPTQLCRWHAHEEYELHLITDTRGKAFVGDFIGEFTPGSLYLIGPNLPHNWVTDKSFAESVTTRDMLVQFNHHNIELAMAGFAELEEIGKLLNMALSGVEFVEFDFDVAREFMARIRDEKGASRVLSFLRFLQLLDRHENKKPLSVVRISQKAGNRKQIKIGEVVDYVSRHYSDGLSISAAAGMAGMSETSFSRNFQAITGNRFTEFVNRVRIGQACVLLFETEEKISSICYDVGFQNLANFNRHFIKMKNMTPSDYRNSARNSLVHSSPNSSTADVQ